MKCEKVLEFLPAFADKSVGAEQAIELTEHLGTCAACAAAWKRHQAVDHFFRAESLPDLPASFWAKSRRQILEQIAWTVPAQQFPLRRLAWLAAAAVILGIGITLFGPSKAPAPTPLAVQPPPSPAPESIPTLDATPDPTMAEVSPESSPEASPEIVVAPPSPAPTPDLTPEPTPDPIVRPDPSTTPSPEVSPEPTPDPIVRPEPSPTLTPEPSVEPTAPPVLAMRLPGDADYLKLIAEEQIAVIRAKDDADTLPALLFSSRKRVLEMEIAATYRPDVMPELVDAHVAIVAEAIDALVTRKIPAALRGEVRTEIGSQMQALEKVKGAERAVAACKAVSAGRSHPESFQSKAKLGLLAMIREMDQVALATGLEKKMDKAIAICNNRLVELDKAQSAGNAAAMRQAAEAYDTILNRGIVDTVVNAANTGTNVATPKARMLAKIQAHLKRYEAALKATRKAEIKPALGLVIEAARVAKERLSRIEDGPAANGGSSKTPWPTSLPGPTGDPAPAPTGTVDPGFDPSTK